MSSSTLGFGAAAGGLSDTDVVIPIGPRNAAMTGALRLVLTVDGDTIVTARPIIGYMHRGAEKLFEVRDYRQILVLANRHDWLSAFNSEIGLALAVEQLLGVAVPVRAVWLRTLLAELGRVLHHLAHLGGDPLGHHRRGGDRAGVRRARGDSIGYGGVFRRPGALHGHPGRRPARRAGLDGWTRADRAADAVRA